MSDDTPTPTPNSRAALYRKIAGVTAAVSRIPKNGRNTFHNYTYATESDITDGLRDLLAEHGLAFLPPSVLDWQRDETVDNPKLGPRTRVQVQFALGCADTGETYTAVLWGEGQDTADKGFYKAYTGAVKYFLMKTFLIATGDDSERDDPPARAPQPAQRRELPPPTPPNGNSKKAPTPEGARARFFDKWGAALEPEGSISWADVRGLLHLAPDVPEPATVAGWVEADRLLTAATRAPAQESA